MSFESIIEHMNGHHQESVIGLCKKYSGTDSITEAKLVGVDFLGLDIVYNNNQKLRVEFPEKCDDSTIKKAIMDLCMNLEKNNNLSVIATEIQQFKAEVASIVIASIAPNGEAISSYAPIIQVNDQHYIYISEVAEHFDSIKTNPTKIEVMYLEDEAKTKTIIARRRLRYRTTAEFIARDSNEFNQALDTLETSMGGAGGIKTIREMRDFHLVKLHYQQGRYVKGFGAAYSIDTKGNIEQVGGKMPHKMPHKQ
ncbi:HugZ family heme oxygenase [Helicobacter monodelphidis]|uniref:HugZ family heme oxygenase n=1 Tax=Helicobacter sp. 15-1451 TaxID=2004995 RepID=UPI000DCC0DFF|nr:HugZ family heme oxygenase [Helicobacter sp. 15-1451]RAX57628.1 HugZ family heme oxygenase [Helicobacter sp. 15-1451]